MVIVDKKMECVSQFVHNGHVKILFIQVHTFIISQQPEVLLKNRY